MIFLLEEAFLMGRRGEEAFEVVSFIDGIGAWSEDAGS